MTWEIREGDALTLLRAMPDASVQCCVTSPPYWGLRDYGTGTWEGGDAECDHARSIPRPDHSLGEALGTRGTQGVTAASVLPQLQTCAKCGATRQDQQLGLEATPEEYVARLVQVFREVRRVLRDDGTLWLNLGDSYATFAGRAHSPGGGEQGERFRAMGAQVPDQKNPGSNIPVYQPNRMPIPGLKPKDLVGIPWRVAFALQADGWWLRSDIIWAKPNPMPESVRDRPTKAHEYVFLLTKSERYHYDADAIAEPAGYAHEAKYDNGKNGHGGGVSHTGQGSSTRKFRSGNTARKYGEDADRPGSHLGRSIPWEGVTRNRRSVWTITTKPYPGAHFATFPPELPELCVLAGCPKGGVVLDPFAGAGTTGVVAVRHGRGFVGLELNPEYADMARRRIHNGSGRLPANGWHPTHDDLPLFGEAAP